VQNNQRDGMHRQGINRGRVAYEPNSLAGGCPFQAGAAGFTSFPQPIQGDKVRGRPEKFADHYSQARLFWISQTPPEQAHIVKAFRFELTKVQTPAIRRRVVSLLVNIDPVLAGGVADGLGIEVPPPLPLASTLPVPVYAPSPALSLLHRPGVTGIHTKRVAILIAAGVDGADVHRIYRSLLEDGAVPRLVSSQLGKVATAHGHTLDVEISMETGPSVLYDAVVIPDGAASAQKLGMDAHALDFVRLQYRHCKPILVVGEGAALLAKAGIPARLPDGSPDPALIGAEDEDLAQALNAFKAVLAGPRTYQRETDPPAI
jgi:catalase